MLRIEEDRNTKGIRITDGKTVFLITAELVHDCDTGHGGGYYVSDVRLEVREEICE